MVLFENPTRPGLQNQPTLLSLSHFDPELISLSLSRGLSPVSSPSLADPSSAIGCLLRRPSCRRRAVAPFPFLDSHSPNRKLGLTPNRQFRAELIRFLPSISSEYHLRSASSAAVRRRRRGKSGGLDSCMMPSALTGAFVPGLAVLRLRSAQLPWLAASLDTQH